MRVKNIPEIPTEPFIMRMTVREGKAKGHEDGR